MKKIIQISMFFVLMASCFCIDHQNEKNDSTISKENKIQIDTLKSLVLTNNYKLIYLYNENNDDKSIRLQKDDILVIDLRKPTQSEIGGFSINWIIKTKNGFQIPIEYGTRYYFSKIFDFKLVNGNFFLSKITIWSFDKFNPENTGRKKSVKVKIPIIDFTFEKYSVD